MDVHLLEVASGVFHVRAQHVGWVMITEGSEVTLVDTGFPGDRARLLRSLRRIGRRPSDVAAILLTHAHPDQLGSAEYLRSTEETPVLVHPDEVDNATGRSIEQVRKPRVLLRAWRPSVALWASEVIGLKARKVDRLTSVDTFDAEPLDVPGRPRPVHTPGHTSGHCVFHLPDRAALLAGDALMTAHAVSRSAGPQLMPRFFNVDSDRARESLRSIAELEASVVVPGHGPAFRGSPAIAVRTALGRT